MQVKDVVIGQVYETKIAGEWNRVVVVQIRPGIKDSRFSWQRRTTFDVRREHEDKVLPKPRSAAMLHRVET